MVKIYGDYIEELPTNVEYLVIGFSPTSVPLKERWRNNGLSADFIADYLHTFFIGQQSPDSKINKKASIRNAVKYVANELLENAMKFNDERIQFPTRIAFHLFSDKLIFHVTNGVSPERSDKFQAFIAKLVGGDPNELYIHQMEANASETTSTHSGLGFLSMICDYSVKLGWKFQHLENSDPPVVLVTTMACLNV